MWRTWGVPGVGLTACLLPAGHSRADEDCGDERARHREERLLGARLDRDQEKLLRESKELADLARLHPTSCAANGLNPNLMVTGGPALTGSGRWSADPAAHLATHPWLPRSGSTSMWLAGHPYGKWGSVSLIW